MAAACAGARAPRRDAADAARARAAVPARSMGPVPAASSVQLNGTELCLHTWAPECGAAGARGVVVVFHGFLAHALYPTVRYAAEVLCGEYVVVAPDLRGHGGSPGPRGLLPAVDGLVGDCVAVAAHARQTYPRGSCFLVGSSMGGALALAVAQRMGAEELAGVALLAPMLKLSVGSFSRSLLRALSAVFPQWQVIPSSSTNADSQYREPARRAECEQDESSVKGSRIRIASASACVELACRLQDDFDKVAIPFLVMVADQDVVVDIQGALDLYDKAPATDKTMKRYPALHGLLCEPTPLRDTIQRDLQTWMRERS